MGTYIRKKKRATRKRTPSKKEPKKLKQKRPLARKPTKGVGKRPTRAKRPKAKRPKAARKSPAPKKRAARKSPAPKKRAARKSPAPKKRATRRPAPKKRATRRPAPKKRASATKKGALSTAEKRRQALARKKRKLTKLESDRQKNRRKRGAKGRPTKAKVRAERKQIETQAAKEFAKQYAEVEQKAREVRQDFEDLLKIARAKKQLPAEPLRMERMASHNREGLKFGVRIREYVTPETIEEILYKVRERVSFFRKKLRQPIWMAVLSFSFMGESLVGYGVRVLDDKHPLANLFYTQGIESSGVWRTEEGMMEALESELWKLAVEQTTIVFCHSIRVFNFRATP